MISSEDYSIQYIEDHSACPFVGTGSPPPPASECVSPLGPNSTRSNTALRVRGMGDSIRTTGQKAWHSGYSLMWPSLTVYNLTKDGIIVYRSPNTSIRDMHTRKIGVKLFYYDKTITRIFKPYRWKIYPGILPVFSARYSIMLSTVKW